MPIISSSNHVYYLNKTTGSWGATVEVEGSTKEGEAVYPDICIDQNNIPQIACIMNGVTTGCIAAIGNVNNATSFTRTTLTSASLLVTTSLIVMPNGDTWVAYSDGVTPFLIRHKNGDSWATWQTAISGVGAPANKISIVGINNLIYYLYNTSGSLISLDIVNALNGIWKGSRTLIAASALNPSARFAFYNDNRKFDKIDFIYGTGTNILYASDSNIRGIVVSNGNTNLASTSGRHVVRTKTGVLYAVVRDSTAAKINMWRSIDDGHTWTQQDSAGSPSGSTYAAQSCAIDSTGIIHVAYFDTTIVTGGCRYVTFSTISNTFSGDTSIATTVSVAAPESTPGTAIAIDSNDKPHVAYADASG